MKRLANSKHILYTLLKAKPKFRKIILTHAPDEVIKSMRDICYNVLYANHEICPKKLRQLRKYKTAMRKISRPHQKTLSTRRMLIQQGGSIIPILIGTVLSLLSNL